MVKSKKNVLRALRNGDEGVGCKGSGVRGKYVYGVGESRKLE